MADPDFSGRTAIVTGAAKGLGRAYARWLAARGCAVVVSNRPAADGTSAAQAVVDEIAAAGGRAAAHDGPVESEAAAIGMADLALERFGGIDIFISNAGVLCWSDFGAMTIDAMREVIDINLWGCVYGLKAVWPVMTGRGYGRIVLTGSSAGLWGQAQSSAYGASKGAMIGLARSLALDVPDGADVRINVVAPAAYTPMSAAHFGERWADYASADKVAPVVGWLASERCRSSGGIYHAGAGHVRRVQILEGPIEDLSSGTLDEVMARLEPNPEWTSSFASGAELMPELAKAMEQP
ncbi:SDR family NAD(P)-dependent oxidoreductase [Rhizorhabdus dicambivorans]|uniref:Short-chain dehydrogenase n=1 Tax=Rhizorhabdus dicambivorans TaxID=1850238 RepID=A0A2A4FV39_9SPHN|nr:SDR family NAD(P)-dependent oxidoreductase [Rhizorhabdus dicambivorans]ATE63936.1 short-chain dehydrogenase [Rhizorhabdus dicambivorans]PCE41542.1 short-chain dehydrogenase [Rhizorhabdus dicambivorans]